ncbi:hypothetical protein HDU86_005204 [Geranomyces michiganensis]|nr:hypothetical protein HDU86_005204 [Geranomyces michiganensis]
MPRTGRGLALRALALLVALATVFLLHAVCAAPISISASAGSTDTRHWVNLEERTIKTNEYGSTNYWKSLPGQTGKADAGYLDSRIRSKDSSYPMWVFTEDGPQQVRMKDLLEAGVDIDKIAREHLIEAESITTIFWAPLMTFLKDNKDSGGVLKKAIEAFSDKDFSLEIRALPADKRNTAFDHASDFPVEGPLDRIVGELLNGANNLEMLIKRLNGLKRNIVNKQAVNSANNRPPAVLATLARYLSNGVGGFGYKIQHSAEHWQRFLGIVADAVTVDPGIIAALDAQGKDGKALVRELATALRTAGQNGFDWYKIDGGLAKQLAGKILENQGVQLTGDSKRDAELYKRIYDSQPVAARINNNANKRKPDHQIGPDKSCKVACSAAGNYVSADGTEVDKFGNKINANGFAQNAAGQLVSTDGLPVDIDGNLINADGQTVTAAGDPMDVDPDQSEMLTEEDLAAIRDGTADSPGPIKVCKTTYCAVRNAKIADHGTNDKLDWGESVGGTEELNGLVSLEDADFFAETEIVDGQVRIKENPTKPRVKLFPRAARDADGKIARTQGSKSAKSDRTESSPGNDVKNAPEGVPYEKYYGVVTPYEGTLDSDMSMDRYISSPYRFGILGIDHMSRTDMHAAVKAAVAERFADAANDNPLTPGQAEGYLKNLVHTQKAIAAKKNRITREPLGEGSDAATEASRNFEISAVNSLEDTFNAMRGVDDANVASASATAGCGANCPKFAPQNMDRIPISRGAAKKLSPKKLAAMTKLKAVVGGGAFAASFAGDKPPAAGNWLASDILAKGGFTETSLGSMWTVIADNVQNTISAPGFAGQAAFEDAMNDLGSALDSEELSFANLDEQLGAFKAFNELADAAKQKPRTPGKVKSTGCSSKSTKCSRAQAQPVSQKLMAVLTQARGIDASGKLFSEGAFPGSPPKDGWIASDIVSGAGDSVSDMDNIMDAVADALAESAERGGRPGMERLQAFMGTFGSYLRDESITSDNVNAHLNGVKAYNKLQRFMARKGLTRPNPSEPDVQRIPGDLAGTVKETVNDVTEMRDLIDLAKTVRGALKDTRVADGDLNSGTPQPSALFAGAKTMEEAIDSIGMVISAAGAVPDAAGMPTGINVEIKTKLKKVINRKLLGIVSKPPATRSLSQVSSYESHLNAFNSAASSGERIGNSVDIRPTDHIQSILTMDIVDQTKSLTRSANIYPDGAPKFDAAGEVLPSSLFAGAKTESDAVDGIVADVAKFLKSVPEGELTTRQKLQIRRIHTNLQKRTAVRESDLDSAVASDSPIGRDDVVTYNRDVNSANQMKVNLAGVDMSEINGMEVQDGIAASTNVNGGDDAFPSFSGNAVDRITARDFSAYKKLTPGSKRGFKTKKFDGSNRQTRNGKPRASMGTVRTPPKKP